MGNYREVSTLASDTKTYRNSRRMRTRALSRARRSHDDAGRRAAATARGTRNPAPVRQVRAHTRVRRVSVAPNRPRARQRVRAALRTPDRGVRIRRRAPRHRNAADDQRRVPRRHVCPQRARRHSAATIRRGHEGTITMSCTYKI